MNNITLLYFEKDARSASILAVLIGCDLKLIHRHDFPDGEFKLQLPSELSERVVIFHTLDHPNEKLIELLFAARTARVMGVRHLTLVAPYLAYMRQDIAFVPGEVVSQRIIGELLASLFDAVITVDPHLHRISRLDEAIPIDQAIVVSAAPLLGDFAAQQRSKPFLMGPDGESAQWIALAASAHQLDYAVASKVRHGDREVKITFPPINVKGRSVVLLDDIASSGHTLAGAAEQLIKLGASAVDVVITHALFTEEVFLLLKRSGISEVWSTDTVTHRTNAVSVLPTIASALKGVLN